MTLWIDTDGGVDDALALACALAVSAGRLGGVSTVFGNVSPRRAARNAALIQSFFPGKSAPVLVGADRPMTGQSWQDARAVHGEDGLGGVSAEHELDFEAGVVEETHPDTVADAMAGFARQHGPEGRIVCTGPLTNLARALLRDPEAFGTIGGIVFMGGSLSIPRARRERGEFNIECDPEAAGIVLDRAPALTVMPLDTCRQVILRRQRLARLADSHDVPVLRFLRRAHNHYMDAYLAVEGIDGCYPHDALAVAAAVGPGGLFRMREARLGFVPDGGFSGLLRTVGTGRTIRVATAADFRAALDWIEACLTVSAGLDTARLTPGKGAP